MNTNASHDSFSDEEPPLDELFALHDLAPDDFAARTVQTLRLRQRRDRIRRFTARTAAAAAAIALLLSAPLLREPSGGPYGIAAATNRPAEPTIHTPERTWVATPATTPTADELTRALHANFSEDEVMFYGHAAELEALLEEAVALSDEESLQTLDMLFLLASN